MKHLQVSVVDKDSKRDKQGIHLLNADKRDLEAAIETAERDMFNHIYIHINTELTALRSKYQKYKTWCKSVDGYVYQIDLINHPCGHDNLSQLEFNKYHAK